MRAYAKRYMAGGSVGFGYRTVVKHGCQYFTIAEERSKSEAQWMARMFNKALKAHDLERKAKEGK